jgi:hypothetical protein
MSIVIISNAGSGGGGVVDSVTAGDASIVISGTAANPTVETGTLDQIATLHPPAAAWSNNSKKITSLANGSGAQDAAAFGQIPAGGAIVSGQFLAAPVSYAPASATVYSLSTAGFAALDAVNLAITFTAPPSGSVLVELRGFVVDGSTGATVWFGLLNASGGALTGPTAEVLNSGLASKDLMLASRHLVTGLTPGTSYTLQWAACASASGASVNAANNGGTTSANPAIANAAPATMAVQAV